MTTRAIRIFCDGKYTLAKRNGRDRWVCASCNKQLNWLVTPPDIKKER